MSMTGNNHIFHLKSSSLLQTAPDNIISHLADHSEYLEFKAGDTIFNRGEIGSSMYIVTHGAMNVQDNGIIVKIIPAGESFGEVGALASETRTATVTAAEDSVLLKIEQDDFYSALSMYPGSAKFIIKALCEKGRNLMNAESAYAIKTVNLQKELEIAHGIQRSFLPDHNPEHQGWEFASFLKPARQVAGDFYDFFEIKSSGHIGVMIGDVCDKGIGAALFMTLFRTLINSLTQFQHQFDCAATGKLSVLLQNSITYANQYVASVHGKSNMFASVFAGVLDPENGKLVYVNAGHEAPLIVNQGGIRQQLETTGPVVGMFEEARYGSAETLIEHDEMLVAYTDGVSEAKNSSEDFFSEPRLYSVIESSPRQAEGMLENILKNVNQFVGDREQYDDTTLIVMRRN